MTHYCNAKSNAKDNFSNTMSKLSENGYIFLSNSWICENLDDIIMKYVRQWLDLPMYATINSVIPTHNHFGQAVQLPYINLLQGHAIVHSTLK